MNEAFSSALPSQRFLNLAVKQSHLNRVDPTMSSHYPQAIVWLFRFLASINLISNGISLVYIKKTFHLTKAVFVLLFLDGLSSTCLAIASVITLIVVSADIITCSVLTYSCILPVIIGNIAMAMVAVIRYFGITALDRPNEKAIIGTTMAFLILMVGTWFGIHLTWIWQRRYPLNVLQVCIFGEELPGITEGERFFIVIPLFGAVLCSLIFDLLIIRKVRKAVAPMMETKLEHYITVPVRATAASVALVFVMAVIIIAGNLLIEQFGIAIQGGIFFIIALLALNTVRCPLVTLLTFKGHKKVLAEIKKEETREALRMREIKHAWRTRVKANQDQE